MLYQGKGKNLIFERQQVIVECVSPFSECEDLNCFDMMLRFFVENVFSSKMLKISLAGAITDSFLNQSSHRENIVLSE